ncbi:MAG: hypothetical protein OXC40_04320 [Proteobacteria bacterium]|nr:hypothetical protein [Pseudomonadota bacterium]
MKLMNFWGTRLFLQSLLLLSLISCRSMQVMDRESDYDLSGVFDHHYLLRLTGVKKLGPRFRFEVCPRDNDKVLEEYCVSALKFQSDEDVYFSLDTIQQQNLTSEEQQGVSTLTTKWQKYKDQIAEKTGITINRSSTAMGVGAAGSVVLGHSAIEYHRLIRQGYGKRTAYAIQFGVTSVEDAQKQLTKVVQDLKNLGWDVTKYTGPTLSAKELDFLQKDPSLLFSNKFVQFVGQSSQEDDILEAAKKFTQQYNDGAVKAMINENFYDRFLEYFQRKRSGMHTSSKVLPCGDGCLDTVFKNQPLSVFDDFQSFVVDQGRANKYMNGQVAVKMKLFQRLSDAVAVKDVPSKNFLVAAGRRIGKRLKIMAAVAGGILMAGLALDDLDKTESFFKSLGIGGNANAQETEPKNTPLQVTEKLTVVLKTPRRVNALWKSTDGGHEQIEAVPSVLRTFVLYQDALWGSDTITNYCIPVSAPGNRYTQDCYTPRGGVSNNLNNEQAEFIRSSKTLLGDQAQAAEVATATTDVYPDHWYRQELVKDFDSTALYPDLILRQKKLQNSDSTTYYPDQLARQKSQTVSAPEVPLDSWVVRLGEIAKRKVEDPLYQDRLLREASTAAASSQKESWRDSMPILE